MALRPEKSFQKGDRWRHSGPLRGLLQLCWEQKRKEEEKARCAMSVGDRDDSGKELFSPGEDTARGVQLFPPAQGQEQGLQG